MAGITDQSARMLLRIHLREPLRFGGIGLVTLCAEHGRVRLERHDRGRVLCMPGLRAMASFASDSSMLPRGFKLKDIGVAGFAGFVPGVGDRQGCNLCNGVAPVMSVLPEAVRHEKGSKTKERQDPNHKHGCDAEQMFGVLHGDCGGNFMSSSAVLLRTGSSMEPAPAASRQRVGLVLLGEITQRDGNSPHAPAPRPRLPPANNPA